MTDGRITNHYENGSISISHRKSSDFDKIRRADVQPVFKLDSQRCHTSKFSVPEHLHKPCSG